MKKLSLLLFIVCVSCGRAPEAPQWNRQNESSPITSISTRYQDLDNKGLPSLICAAEKDYQTLDQFEWILPTKPEVIKILKYRIKNSEKSFAVKIAKHSIEQSQIEILFRKTKQKDFRDNTLSRSKNFESAVLQSGVPTEIYISDEIIHCTFNNP